MAAHRRAVRESQAHVDALRAELEALGLPVHPAQRRAGGRAAVGALEPDERRRRPAARGARSRCSASSTPARDREQAREAALALRERIAGSSLDLKRERHHVEVDRDLEQVIYAHRTAQQTTMGWLMGAMLTRQPYTLSVYVHALDRRRERQRIKLGYRRLFAINRGAEQRGRVPDFDRYAQEREYEQLLGRDGRPRARRTCSRSPSTRRSARAARRPTWPRSARRSTTASSSSSRRRTARSTAASSASPSCGRAPCRSAATSPAACASTRPATSATRCRWSAPPAARRPGSRSRSPTRAARSSAWTPTTPSTPTTRC